MVKKWVATDLLLGSLKITPREGEKLHVERRYVFLDGYGVVLEQVQGGRLVVDVVISDLPAGIINALVVIDNWTKNQALIKEGMSE